MKKFYVTKHEYTPGVGREKGGGDVITEPGKAQSIQEIFERFQQGLLPPENSDIYFDEEDIDKISHFRQRGLDLTDLDELARINAETSLAINNALKKRADDRREEAKRIAIEEEKAKLAAALTDPKNDG